jgi:hypothetical protein
MVRIRLPAAAAAAVMALAACSSINGGYAAPGVVGLLAGDALFPPPPPVLSEEATVPPADMEMDRALTELRATLMRLSAEVDKSRQHLTELQAEVERTRAQIERLLERGHWDTPARPATMPASAERAGGRPFVRIRFDQPFVDHSDALREAVQTALAQLPDAGFEVVAILSVGGGNPAAAEHRAAQLHAKEVVATLLDMGLSPGQLTLSSASESGGDSDEVRIYIR